MHEIGCDVKARNLSTPDGLHWQADWNAKSLLPTNAADIRCGLKQVENSVLNNRPIFGAHNLLAEAGLLHIVVTK